MHNFYDYVVVVRFPHSSQLLVNAPVAYHSATASAHKRRTNQNFLEKTERKLYGISVFQQELINVLVMHVSLHARSKSTLILAFIRAYEA
eukprot:IDg7122t1